MFSLSVWLPLTIHLFSRRDGDLPDGISATGGRLVFGRPLVLTDTGVYECEARNHMGADKGELQVTVRGGCTAALITVN